MNLKLHLKVLYYTLGIILFVGLATISVGAIIEIVIGLYNLILLYITESQLLIIISLIVGFTFLYIIIFFHLVDLEERAGKE